MAETYTSVIWTNDSGQRLNATNVNRIDSGIKVIDTRTARLELGVDTPVTVTYAASLTLDATLGALFRCTATGNLTLADITGGVNGQEITLEVRASGADRTVTVAGTSTVVQAGQWWSGSLRYNASTDTWLLTGSSGGGSSTTAPRYVGAVVTSAYAASVSIDASVGTTFRVTATGNLALAGITNGIDGQEVSFQVLASGGSRTITVGGASAAVPAGKWFWGRFAYIAAVDQWLFSDLSGLSWTPGAAPSSGFGLSPFGTAPFGS